LILVDQSANGPLSHITKQCTGKKADDNYCLDCNDFISIDGLHAEDNRFNVNDCITILIKIEQEFDEDKLSHCSKNIQDAMQAV
jgi:hypothetical protein